MRLARRCGGPTGAEIAEAMLQAGRAAAQRLGYASDVDAALHKLESMPCPCCGRAFGARCRISADLQVSLAPVPTSRQETVRLDRAAATQTGTVSPKARNRFSRRIECVVDAGQGCFARGPAGGR